MWFLLIAFFIVVWIALFVRQRDIVAAAYYSGYRQAVKDSVDVVNKEAETRLVTAPEGHLQEALNQSSVLSSVKHKIRELSFRIGRPV